MSVSKQMKDDLAMAKDPVKKNNYSRRVLAFLIENNGSHTIGMIEEETDLSSKCIYGAMVFLRSKGKVIKLGYGETARYKYNHGAQIMPIVKRAGSQDDDIRPIFRPVIYGTTFNRKIEVINRVIPRMMGKDKDIMINVLNDYKALMK